jgi:hypothetical protein
MPDPLATQLHGVHGVQQTPRARLLSNTKMANSHVGTRET